MKLICHLKNIYYRLFYFFFRIEKRDNQGGEETDRFAAVVAILPMSILCYSGFFTLLYLISRFVIPMRLPSGTFFILFAIVDIGLNSFLFFRKRRYLKIKELLLFLMIYWYLVILMQTSPVEQLINIFWTNILC